MCNVDISLVLPYFCVVSSLLCCVFYSYFIIHKAVPLCWSLNFTGEELKHDAIEAALYFHQKLLSTFEFQLIKTDFSGEFVEQEI